jgi:hypothetical protein
VRNLVILGTARPPEAADVSNLVVNERAFVGAARDDYRLAPGSPAVDAGVVMPGVPTDRAGQARSQGARPDVGAFESPAP